MTTDEMFEAFPEKFPERFSGLLGCHEDDLMIVIALAGDVDAGGDSHCC